MRLLSLSLAGFAALLFAGGFDALARERGAPPHARRVKAERARAPAAEAQESAHGYYVPYLTGPDGRKYPIMEIPGSAQVVPKQLIDDQQATTVGEALRNVSGVYVRGR